MYILMALPLGFHNPSPPSPTGVEARSHECVGSCVEAAWVGDVAIEWMNRWVMLVMDVMKFVL